MKLSQARFTPLLMRLKTSLLAGLALIVPLYSFFT